MLFEGLCEVCRKPLPAGHTSMCSGACRTKASRRRRSGKPVADPFTAEEYERLWEENKQLKKRVAQLEKPRRETEDWEKRARSAEGRLETAQKRLEAKEAKITRILDDNAAVRRIARSANTETRHAYKDVDKTRVQFSKYFPYAQALKYLFQLNGLVSQYARAYPELARVRKTRMPGLQQFLRDHREEHEEWIAGDLVPSSRELLDNPRPVSIPGAKPSPTFSNGDC